MQGNAKSKPCLLWLHPVLDAMQTVMSLLHRADWLCLHELAKYQVPNTEGPTVSQGEQEQSKSQDPCQAETISPRCDHTTV